MFRSQLAKFSSASEAFESHKLINISLKKILLSQKEEQIIELISDSKEKAFNLLAKFRVNVINKNGNLRQKIYLRNKEVKV